MLARAARATTFEDSTFFTLFRCATIVSGLLPSLLDFFVLAAACVVCTLFSGTAADAAVPLTLTGQGMGKPRRMKGQGRKRAQSNRKVNYREQQGRVIAVYVVPGIVHRLLTLPKDCSQKFRIVKSRCRIWRVDRCKVFCKGLLSDHMPTKPRLRLAYRDFGVDDA